MKEVTQLLGIHQTNTTAYTQGKWSDSLHINHYVSKKRVAVTRIRNSLMSSLLIELVSSNLHMNHLSTCSMVMIPGCPTEAVLTPAKARSQVDLREYGIYLTEKLTEAWDLARTHIKRAQKQQKPAYDQHARTPNFSVGDRVFLLKPAEKTGEGRKLA